MKKADLQTGLIVRAKQPEETNYQIWPDKWKQVFKYARVTSVISQYLASKGRSVTYVYFVPFNGNQHAHGLNNGLVSCRTLAEFKKEFKPLKFNKA